MARSKTVYVCSECGYETSKWMGKCPKCGAWNSFVEDVIDTSAQSKTPAEAKRGYSIGSDSHAVPLDKLEADTCIRSLTGLGELDRVLGGGLVSGSVVLLSGEPGIGKSTLLLQISHDFPLRSASAMHRYPDRWYKISSDFRAYRPQRLFRYQ